VAGDLILVTGGTGFLGHHLVPALLSEGFRVRLLVREGSHLGELAHLPVELATGDLSVADGLAQAVRGARHVVHAAAHFRFWGSSQIFRQVNVHGTRAIAQAALDERVERFIHISAVAVVGRQKPGQVIDEQTPCRPQDDYQRTKLEAEQELQKLFVEKGLPVVILRPGAFYGPHGRYGFNRLFIEDPRRGLPLQVQGGRRITFPVFVPDVADMICHSFREARLGEVYNICGKPVTHAEVDQVVSRLLGIRSRRWNIPWQLMVALAAAMEFVSHIRGREPFYPLNLRHYVFTDWNVSSAKAQRELRYSPTPLEEGLRQTVDWYRSQVW
jgi:dihydroflavonol-4-reductase